MISHWKALIASTDVENRRAIAAILNAQGLDPIFAGTVAESLQALENENVVLVFCDRQLTGGGPRELLRVVRSSKTLVVITSRQSDWDEYLDAMRLGAFDVIASPCVPTDVEWMAVQAARYERDRARRGLAFETGRTMYGGSDARQTA